MVLVDKDLCISEVDVVLLHFNFFFFLGRLVTTYSYTVLLPETYSYTVLLPKTYGARCFHSLGLLGLCLVVWWSF